MAVIPVQKVSLPDHGPFSRGRVVQWPNMTTGDTGEPVSLVNLADRSVIGIGSFAGATLEWEGFIGDPLNTAEVNNADNWAKLTDPSDNMIAMIGVKIEAIAQICVLVRPRVTGGTAPSITARLLCKD